MQGRLRWGIRSERGFSLIELLVVMLVIAILAAITLERGSGMDKRTCSPVGQGGCPANGEW